MGKLICFYCRREAEHLIAPATYTAPRAEVVACWCGFARYADQPVAVAAVCTGQSAPNPLRRPPPESTP